MMKSRRLGDIVGIGIILFLGFVLVKPYLGCGRPLWHSIAIANTLPSYTKPSTKHTGRVSDRTHSQATVRPANHAMRRTHTRAATLAVTRAAMGRPVLGTADYRSLLENAFSAAHAHATTFEIHDWSQVNAKFMAPSALLQSARYVVQELKLQKEKEYIRQASQANYVEIDGMLPATGADVAVYLASFEGQSGTPGTSPNGSTASNASGNFTRGTLQQAAWSQVADDSQDPAGETILVVRASSAIHQFQSFSATWEKIQPIISKLAVTPQISACLEGFVSARLSDVSVNHLIAHSFTVVGARSVEGLQSSTVTSISGYSPLCQSYILTNGQKMNLQIAVHYDAYHDRTNVLVGSPILNVTY